MMRDRDSDDLALQIQSLVWSLVGGGIGALFGYMIARLRGWPVPAGVAGGFVVVGCIMFVIIATMSRTAAHAMVSTIAPSGRSTPSRTDYSLAESHVARARYDEALAEYRRQAALAPEEPEIYLRMARLHRDRLTEPEQAVTLFLRALAVSGDGGTEQLAARELVELFERRMNAPERALPVLARLAAERKGSSAGDWARGELNRLKRDLHRPSGT